MNAFIKAGLGVGGWGLEARIRPHLAMASFGFSPVPGFSA